MNGVLFGSYHSYDDLNLVLVNKTIGNATTKTKYINVDGANGMLDYTDYFGEPKYTNRILKFEFKTIVHHSHFMEVYSSVQNAIHGKKMKIVLDVDADYYYIGRVEVSAFTNDKNIGAITVTCNCEPWKYKKHPTLVKRAVSGTANINLVNSRKRVVPTITTTASMTIAFDGVTTTASAGTFTIPTLELSEGNNSVTVTGTGNITFTYQEGGL